LRSFSDLVAAAATAVYDPLSSGDIVAATTSFECRSSRFASLLQHGQTTLASSSFSTQISNTLAASSILENVRNGRFS
jgi:hypothetical protein